MIARSSPIPDARPSPILTSGEACEWLRLVEPGATPDENAAAVRALHRLVRLGEIRPLRPGRSYAFHIDELRRYAEAAVAAWPDRPPEICAAEPAEVEP